MRGLEAGSQNLGGFLHLEDIHFDVTLFTTLIAYLNDSVISGASVRDTPIVRVIGKQFPNAHCFDSDYYIDKLIDYLWRIFQLSYRGVFMEVRDVTEIDRNKCAYS